MTCGSFFSPTCNESALHLGSRASRRHKAGPQTPARQPPHDGALHVTSPVHRSSLWSQHMYVNKYTRGATPASSMPTFDTDGPALAQEPLWRANAQCCSRCHASHAHASVSARTGPRSYKSQTHVHTRISLETPRQHRPCQRFGTDWPALVQEPLCHHTRNFARDAMPATPLPTSWHRLARARTTSHDMFASAFF